jgi:inosine-uridine nucleoside N-ribohydrolase
VTKTTLLCVVSLILALLASGFSKEKVIIDTDIGDDIDDAFAVALALRSPQLEILGLTTTFRDTQSRARLADHLLEQAGRIDVPVAAGKQTSYDQLMSQQVYADNGPHKTYPDAVEFILQQIRRYPHQVTLIAIGPLMNLGALIDRDPRTFRRLRRVVIMGGSINFGYGDKGAEAEWNIRNDVPSARKLFSSGVPIYVMPLDSTANLKMGPSDRQAIFLEHTPLTDALTELYHEWGQETPVLFDAMTVAYILRQDLCPTTPMHIVVDEHGFTLAESGAANAEVCLHSEPAAFFHFYLQSVQ